MEKSFGEAFREFRESMGISMRSLANEAEMDPAYLSRLENGKTGAPKNDTVIRLAQAFCAVQALDQRECDDLTRHLMVAAGHLQDREELIDDLTDRFRAKLAKAGLTEPSIDDALAKVPLATMREVLLGQEPLEIGLKDQYSPNEICKRWHSGEEVFEISGENALSIPSLSEEQAPNESALDYLDRHADKFKSRGNFKEGFKSRASGPNQRTDKVIAAGNDVEIRISRPVSKQQMQQLRLIAKLIDSIMEN